MDECKIKNINKYKIIARRNRFEPNVIYFDRATTSPQQSSENNIRKKFKQIFYQTPYFEFSIQNYRTVRPLQENKIRKNNKYKSEMNKQAFQQNEIWIN